jgi:hypothetical protein
MGNQAHKARDPQMAKDLQKFLKKLAAAGWTVTITKNNHYKLLGPRGELVHTSSTPSDWRALKKVEMNVRNEMRRCA